jgi:hypothetical protein
LIFEDFVTLPQHWFSSDQTKATCLDRAKVETAISDVLAAWDKLKPGTYSGAQIEAWLLHMLKPAIERLRG